MTTLISKEDNKTLSLITKNNLRILSSNRKRDFNFRYDSNAILFGEQKPNIAEKFDIFLCHSSLDSDLILGLREYFQSLQFSVYIDWYNDPQLDRTQVNKATADMLRLRMRASSCLFFASSTNSPNSKWMPWECGYFDGTKGKVAICPIVESSIQADNDNFQGQEYLGLYPYVANGVPMGGGAETLWIHEGPKKYVCFADWLRGKNPTTKI